SLFTTFAFLPAVTAASAESSRLRTRASLLMMNCTRLAVTESDEHNDCGEMLSTSQSAPARSAVPQGTNVVGVVVADADVVVVTVAIVLVVTPVLVVVLVVDVVDVVEPPPAPGSTRPRNAWSVVTPALLVDARSWQLRKSGRPLFGDGSFADRQLNRP